MGGGGGKICLAIMNILTLQMRREEKLPRLFDHSIMAVVSETGELCKDVKPTALHP